MHLSSSLKHLNEIVLIGFLCLNVHYCDAVTMEQFEQSMTMMRAGCQPKHKISTEILDKMRVGEFTMGNHDLMCYTKCIAQMAGTLTKKGEFSFNKAIAQIPIILPPEMQGPAVAALESCKEVQDNYKDLCEKTFYTTKCVADFDRKTFKFP